MSDSTGDAAESDVVGRMTVSPDPAFVKSLGTHHTIESAMADLVDNSIDAGATEVTIQIVTSKGRLSAILVLDNGSGMDSPTVDRAMKLGGRRDYAVGDLGHFGVGLKAAALGNAGVLTVWSHKHGATPVGRRIRKLDLERDYSCEVLSPEAAQRAIDYSLPGRPSGTVIALDDMQAGIHGMSRAEATVWLTNKQNDIRQHLGIVYHRILARGQLWIETVEISSDGTSGSPTPIVPIDPFGYPYVGDAVYPVDLRTEVGGVDVAVSCHIWPARYDNKTEYRLLGKSGEELEGFYVYRADRLLQAGGWNGVTTVSPHKRLARVSIDADSLGDLVQLNPEKNDTKFQPVLAEALSRASSRIGNHTIRFQDFLADSESAYVKSKKRTHRPVTVVEPGQGLPPRVRRKMAEELVFHQSEAPVDIKWKRLPVGTFFEIDRNSRILWLNAAYRDLFTPGHKGSNDAPIIKMLLFLLTQDHFTGVQYSSTKKNEAHAWQHLLVSAADEEIARRRSKEIL